MATDTVTTKSGVQIYFKDWGLKEAPPVMFHHGWPLSADDWDNSDDVLSGKGGFRSRGASMIDEDMADLFSNLITATKWTPMRPMSMISSKEEIEAQGALCI